MENTNAINWFEIPVTDLDRAKLFYNSLFNVELELGENKYAFFPNATVGGALAKGENYIPSKTGSLVYLNAGTDLNNVLQNIEPSGGKIILTKTSIGEMGFVARFIDTEGNLIVLNSLN